MAGWRQVQPPILQPAIEPVPVPDRWKKVRAGAGDKIAQVQGKADEMPAQRFVVQPQHHPPVLFEHDPRLAEPPLANGSGQSLGAKRLVVLIVGARSLPSPPHLGLEPAAPVVAQPASWLARRQLLGRRHGQQNHPVGQIQPFDHRQRIGIFLLQANQKDAARHQVITERWNGETWQAIAQMASGQALQPPGMEQKHALHRSEHAPAKGFDLQPGSDALAHDSITS